MSPLPIRAPRPALGLALLAGALLAPPAAAQSVETFVLTVGGHSAGAGCTTFRAPDPVLDSFGSLGPSIPIPGLPACAVAGDYRSAGAASGPLFDAMGLATSWDPDGAGANSVSADAHALADFGDLTAHARTGFGYVTGGGGTLVVGAESFGLCSDSITITSPTVAAGQLGSVRLLLAVSGGLSATANGTADVELVYRVGAGPTFTAFRAQVFGLGTPFVVSATGNGLAGFATAPGTMSGGDVVDSLPITFVFGTPWTLRLGLLAYTVPAPISSDLQSDFRVRLVGFQVLGPGGVPVPDAVVTAASGAEYGALPARGRATAGALRGPVTLGLPTQPSVAAGPWLPLSVLPAQLGPLQEIWTRPGVPPRTPRAGGWRDPRAAD